MVLPGRRVRDERRLRAAVGGGGGYTTSAPDGWTWAGAADKVGVAAQAQRFGGVAGDPLPAPAEGRQFAYMIGVGSLYQQVGLSRRTADTR
jgi:hypothetical protein